MPVRSGERSITQREGGNPVRFWDERDDNPDIYGQRRRPRPKGRSHSHGRKVGPAKRRRKKQSSFSTRPQRRY